MSAFLVNHYHIDRLIATAQYGPAGVRRGLWHSSYLLEKGPDATGRMLIDANTHSVNYRYKQNDAPEEYQFSPLTQPMTVVDALKALACYEYQSCEDTETWPGSAAHDWCERFRSMLIQVLPGYQDAPWEQAPLRVTA